MTDSAGKGWVDADYYPGGYPERSQGRQELDCAATCSPSYKFAGYESDSETANYFAFFRYYSPRLGRFMTADPLGGNVGSPQSLNRYSYVTNNPANATDPLGLVVIFDYDRLGGGGFCPACLYLGTLAQGGIQFGSNFNEFDLMNIPIVAHLGTFYISAGPGVVPGYPEGYVGLANLAVVVGSGLDLFGFMGDPGGTPQGPTGGAGGRNTANCVQGALQEGLGVRFGPGSGAGGAGGHGDFRFTTTDPVTAQQAAFINSTISSNEVIGPGSRISTSFGALHIPNPGAAVPNQPFRATAHVDLFNPNNGLGPAALHGVVEGLGGHLVQLFGGTLDRKCAPPPAP